MKRLKTVFAAMAIVLISLLIIISYAPRNKASPKIDKNTVRVIKVGVVAENGLKKVDAEWEQKFRKSLKEVSKIYLKEFGIKLELTILIKTEKVPLPTLGYLLRAWLGLKKEKDEKLKNCDIVFYVSSLRCFQYLPSPNFLGDFYYESDLQYYIEQDLSTTAVVSKSSGKAWFFCGDPITAPFKNSGCLNYLIGHELGHLFGAKHTEKISIMQNHWYPPLTFDSENKKIILKNKFKKFN